MYMYLQQQLIGKVVGSNWSVIEGSDIFAAHCLLVRTLLINLAAERAEKEITFSKIAGKF